MDDVNDHFDGAYWERIDRYEAGDVCLHCKHPIVASSLSPTSYTHWRSWLGVGCPGLKTQATPSFISCG
jgi:hypothetical protein